MINKEETDLKVLEWEGLKAWQKRRIKGRRKRTGRHGERGQERGGSQGRTNGRQMGEGGKEGERMEEEEVVNQERRDEG